MLSLIKILVNAVDGCQLGKITHCTSLIELIFPDGLSEQIDFHVFPALTHQVILGHPWLTKHNPNFDWVKGQVTSWGKSCQE